MTDAEIVAAARQSGPNLAEFVSDYFAICEDEPPSPEEIAMVWAERALDGWPMASDHVYHDLVTVIIPDVEYYLP